MTKRVQKGAGGKYHVGGGHYEYLIGSRAQVWHGTAHKTSGGLTKAHLVMNKWGRIVSKKKHVTARREKRLQKHGYYARKGKFGVVTRGAATRRRRRRRDTRRR
jgi:hypothetical protein